MAAALGVVMLLAAVMGAGSAHARGARAAASCPNAGTPARRLTLTLVREAVVCLINLQRTERGLPALTDSPRLDDSAQQWSDEMVRTGQFGHGTDFTARVSAAGYQWQAAAENVATGQRTPHAVVAAWMASAEHCQTILNPEFRNVGTGESPHPVPGYAKHEATWTQDFGLMEGNRPPSHDARPASACPY